MFATKQLTKPTTNTMNVVLRFRNGRLIIDRRIEFNSFITAAELTKLMLEKDQSIINSGVLEHVGHDHGMIEVDGQIVAVWRNHQIDGDLPGVISQISHKISADGDEDEESNWKRLFDRSSNA